MKFGLDVPSFEFLTLDLSGVDLSFEFNFPISLENPFDIDLGLDLADFPSFSSLFGDLGALTVESGGMLSVVPTANLALGIGFDLENKVPYIDHASGVELDLLALGEDLDLTVAIDAGKSGRNSDSHSIGEFQRCGW